MVLKKKRKSKGKILICGFLVKNAWKSLLERKISRHFSWSPFSEILEFVENFFSVSLFGGDQEVFSL
jgi:hypothetical protein